MAEAESIGSRVAAFADSTSGLAAKMNTTFESMENLQRSWMVMTSGEDKLTPDSYSATPGSPEERLLEALGLRRAVADVLDQYGQVMSAMTRGESAEEVKNAGALFQAASDHLETLNGGKAADQADSDMAKDEKSAGPKKLSPREAELLGAKNKTVGLMGFVAKVAGLSTAGKISGIFVIVNSRVTTQVRLKRGAAELKGLAPKTQADVETLSGVLADSYDPLDKTTDHLVGEIVTWHNKNVPSAEDPGRYPYEMDVAAILADARGIKTSLKAILDAYGQLGAAHQEIVKMLTAVPTDRSASDRLLKLLHHAKKS